jgi:hypothetical protein
VGRLIAVALVALLAVQCADNPAGASPTPFTQTMTGTVAAAGTSRQVLAIPRSGNLVLTLSWPGAVDLNLYLAPSSCSALNPKSQCNVLLQSNYSTSQESIARPVKDGEAFSVFIENVSTSSSSSYTLNIRIQDPHLDSPF